MYWDWGRYKFDIIMNKVEKRLSYELSLEASDIPPNLLSPDHDRYNFVKFILKTYITKFFLLEWKKAPRMQI